MHTNLIKYIALATTLGLVGFGGGCYENIEPAPTANSPSTGPSSSPAPSTGLSRGGQSSLGGAKKAAEGVISDAEQQSRELAESLDGE